jgi:hypothetical protein
MTRRVLLLGRLPNFVEGFQRQLNVLNVELIGCAGVDDVRAALAQGDIDHVIVGGGLDLGIRLDVVKEVFQSSDKATVHLKDHLSGPEGFVPFARSVLQGLNDYEPQESPGAILRAQRDDRAAES